MSRQPRVSPEPPSPPPSGPSRRCCARSSTKPSPGTTSRCPWHNDPGSVPSGRRRHTPTYWPPTHRSAPTSVRARPPGLVRRDLPRIPRVRRAGQVDQDPTRQPVPQRRPRRRGHVRSPWQHLPRCALPPHRRSPRTDEGDRRQRSDADRDLEHGHERHLLPRPRRRLLHPAAPRSRERPRHPITPPHGLSGGSHSPPHPSRQRDRIFASEASSRETRDRPPALQPHGEGLTPSD